MGKLLDYIAKETRGERRIIYQYERICREYT